MTIKKFQAIITITICDADIKFSKDIGSKDDSVGLVIDPEKESPLDIFTEEEIRNAEEIARDEFHKRNI